MTDIAKGKRRWQRIMAAVLLSGGMLFGAEATGGGETALTPVQERDRQQLMAADPRLDVALMIRFYEEYSPDLLDEWRRRSQGGNDSAEYLRRLAAHFRKLEEVRQSDMAEYTRLLEYEKLQRQVRLLSREIQRLLALREELLSQETESARLANLAQARHDLKILLERAFDESLRQQYYEIDKLEAEITELRKLADERKGNRQQTLKQRYRLLTGQEMPE